MSKIYTYTGRFVDLLNLRPQDIHLDDIAHALSRICRFNGHCGPHLSVAQHSCMVSYICSTANKPWGLMHDAAEAYISDIPGPIKSYMPDYQSIEDEILEVIALRFDLGWPMPNEVKKADHRVGLSEIRTFLDKNWNYENNTTPAYSKVIAWKQEEAKEIFLRNAKEYCIG